MNREAWRALYDQDQRIEARHPGARREEAPGIVRYVSDADRNGAVLYSQLDAETADAAIDGEQAYFDGLGYDLEWKLYDHDSPADLKNRLQAHGFAIGDSEAVLALDLNDAPASLFAPVTHDVRRLTDPADIKIVVELNNAIWNEDHRAHGESIAREMREQPDLVSVYVAYVDDVPASAARINFSPGGQFAGLWGGSTLPEYRKRGLYTALLSVRAQEARRRGVRFLTVDASPMSRPILEKLGFQFIAYSWPCTWSPSGG